MKYFLTVEYFTQSGEVGNRFCTVTAKNEDQARTLAKQLTSGLKMNRINVELVEKSW